MRGWWRSCRGRGTRRPGCTGTAGGHGGRRWGPRAIEDDSECTNEGGNAHLPTQASCRVSVCVPRAWPPGTVRVSTSFFWHETSVAELRTHVSRLLLEMTVALAHRSSTSRRQQHAATAPLQGLRLGVGILARVLAAEPSLAGRGERAQRRGERTTGDLPENERASLLRAWQGAHAVSVVGTAKSCRTQIVGSPLEGWCRCGGRRALCVGGYVCRGVVRCAVWPVRCSSTLTTAQRFFTAEARRVAGARRRHTHDCIKMGRTNAPGRLTKCGASSVLYTYPAWSFGGKPPARDGAHLTNNHSASSACRRSVLRAPCALRSKWKQCTAPPTPIRAGTDGPGPGFVPGSSFSSVGPGFGPPPARRAGEVTGVVRARRTTASQQEASSHEELSARNNL